MIKDIKYNGFTEVPDDYECPDGDLAGVVDLVPEDGALKPVVPPAGKFVLPENMDFLFIHDTPDYTHYILLDKHDPSHNKLYWVDADAIDSYQPKPVPATTITAMIGGQTTPVSGGTVHDFGSVPVDGIDAVGNMLCVSAGGTTHYILWKSASGSYVYLGDVIPHPDIQFKLDLRYVQDWKSHKDTGISVVATGNNSTTNFLTQAVSPTPLESGEFSTETVVSIEPTAALSTGGTYKLMISARILGNQATPFTVYLVYPGEQANDPDVVQFAAMSTDINGLYPYAVFVTDSVKTVKRIDVHLWANGKQTKNVELTLLQGDTGTSTADYMLKDEWEVFTAVMGRANDFIARYSTDKNMFLHPFFVRYAVRLYDGSYVSPSAPCLMIPNRGTVPRIWYTTTVGSGDEKKVDTFASASFGQLAYRIVNSLDLSDWSDIITGIVFAVSDPIWNYNQGKEWKTGENAIGVRLMKWDELTRGDDVWSYGSYESGEGVCTLTYLISKSQLAHPEARELVLPHFDDKVIEDRIKSTSLFHIVSDVELSDLPTSGEWVTVEMKEGTLSTLASRRTLDDNALSLSGRSGFAMSIYNSRLVLADVTEKKFKGHKLQTMQGKSGANVNSSQPRTVVRQSKVIIELVDNTSSYTICSSDVATKSNSGDVFWVYYPSVNAKSAVLAQNDGTVRWRFAEITLKPHDTLDGAYWFDGFNEPDWSSWINYTGLTAQQKAWADMPDTGATLRYPSKVQQSEVNNPLVFTNVRTNLVGTGRVMAVCAAVKALSQGQFGHFPLYAFTTEGVWSLSVGTDGAFSAIQPVTRDVCLSKDSVTQLDDAVLFATERGIMLLSGSTVKCISDDVNSKSPFDVTTLPQYAALLEAGDCETGEMGYVPFLDYIKGSRMIYDYVHQRVVVYNPDKPYAYVYSLGSGKWGMMRSDLDDDVNSWPEALGVDDDGTVVDFSETDPTQGVKGMLITRPFKLEPHDALKTINTIIQRGYFDFHNDGTVKKVQQILYGSRDLFNWHIVWSSQDQYLRGFRGTPYKYFRLALICNLDEKENLYGFTVQYEPRYLNQPR